MSPGKIYLANFPFGDAPGIKLRPVLALTGAIGPVPEVLVAYISSVIPKASLPTDITLDPRDPDHRSTTNLRTTSVLRLGKLATIHARSIVRDLGSISPATRAQATSNLRALLALS